MYRKAFEKEKKQHVYPNQKEMVVNINCYKAFSLKKKIQPSLVLLPLIASLSSSCQNNIECLYKRYVIAILKAHN